MVSSVTYHFSQLLGLPAREAYRWCTDYKPNDLSLMGHKGRRAIKRLTKDTIVLNEIVYQNGRKISKTKLVKLNPRRLSWHNFQLRGPNKYSEFLYEIVPEGKRKSRLNFTGLLVVYNANMSKLRRLAKAEKSSDSNTWKLLAKAMKNESHIHPSV